MPLAAMWMNLKNIRLTTSDREDKYCMISLTCGIQKYNTNESMYKIEIDSQTYYRNEFMVTKGERDGGGGEG